MGKISVALCTYNGARFLGEQLDSIMQQQLPVDEIVVCDDGSTDETLDILEKYNGAHPGIFSIHCNEKNLRSVKNFEKAISLCTGDFIFLSDQDDIWAPEKTADYIEFFGRHPQIDVLASNGYCINDASEVQERYAIWEVPHVLRTAGHEVNYARILATLSNLATGASMALRRSILPQILPFPTIKDFHHDEWIAVVAASRNSFELLHGKYFYYREHDNQQVGGVFYDKTAYVHEKFEKIFSLDDFDLTFSMYKKRLRGMAWSYHKQSKLAQLAPAHRPYFEQTLHKLEAYRNRLLNEMRRRYPLRAALLSVTDRLLGKRQFVE